MNKTPKDEDVIAGQRLKSLRKMRGFSQAHVADALKISFQQVQKYENGTNRIPLSRLSKICELMDAAPSYFIAGNHGTKEVPAFNSSFTPKIATKLEQLTAHQGQLVLMIINQFLSGNAKATEAKAD